MAYTEFKKELNRQFLSGAIRHPEILAECHLTEKDFDRDVNRVVFSALKACVDDCRTHGTKFSEYVLIDRMVSMGLKLGGMLDPAIYVTKLLGLAINQDAALSIAKEIGKTSVRRELYEAAQRVQQAIEEDAGAKKSLNAIELISKTTGIFNEKTNMLSSGDDKAEPKDLYGTIGTFLKRDNSISDRAIATPFPLLNDLYGFMDVGSVLLYCSRMKIGKSSWWLSMGQQLAAADQEDRLRILVLDTELELWENHSRSLAAISGVSEFRIRQGWYRKRSEETEKVEAAARQLEQLEHRVLHCYCGGMSLEQLESIARRWAFKNLTEGKRGLIVYDYIKLNSQEDWSSGSPLFIKIGEKMDSMKRLSKELAVPIMCFAQTNRENIETKAGERMQNTGVVGGSDMLAQFASNVYLLSELTPEERAAWNLLGANDATHSLIDVACRQRGPCELGEDRLVRISDLKSKKDKYVKNFLLYRFKQFHVTEMGTLRQVIAKNAALGIDIQPALQERKDLL
jgi:replicative DNA helicase